MSRFLAYSKPSAIMTKSWSIDGRTEYFPAFAQSLAVLRVDDIHHCVAVIVVAVPYGTYSPLPAEVPELENGGWKGDFAHCGAFSLEVLLDTRTRHVLFCPTVGAILSGDNPGVSVYIVLIFSSNV